MFYCVCFARQILASIVDPLVQMCSVSASRLNTIDMATYMINCLYLIQTTVSLYEYTHDRLEMLQAQVTCTLYDVVHIVQCGPHCTELSTLYMRITLDRVDHTVHCGPPCSEWSTLYNVVHIVQGGPHCTVWIP